MPSIGLIRTPRQQALLEAHEHAFAYFGGVFKTLRYDNMKSVGEEDSARISAGGDGSDYRVSLALGLPERVLQPGQRQRKRRRGRRVGWFRRNLLVPVPEAVDLTALNQQVLRDCVANRDRTIIGRSMTIGTPAS